MFIIDIANEIFLDEGSPTYTSLPAICFWIRGKIGTVNSLLCEDYKINEITKEVVNCNGCRIGIDAVGIIKQLYRIYSLQIQINNNMNALAKDSLLSVTDEFGGGQFTRVNKNEISKTLLMMRKDETEILNNLVGLYKINKSTPSSLSGDDIVPAYYGEHLISLRDV